MEETAQHLLETLEKALPLLHKISEAEASAKPHPEKWSKKEILGHLAHVIRNTPPKKLENTISIEGSDSFSLRFIMSDYVEHLKHHLKQILPEAGFTSSFENLY